jgi:hypothetical protein
MLSPGVYGGHHDSPPCQGPCQDYYNQRLVPGQYTHAHEQYDLAQSLYQQLPFYNQSPVHSQYDRTHSQNPNIEYQQQHPHFHHQSLSPPYSHNPNYQILQQHYGAPAPSRNLALVPVR